MLTDKAPYDRNLPRASICIWPYGEDNDWRTVLEVYLASPAKIKQVYEIASDKRFSSVWEPIQEIIDWECQHGRGRTTSQHDGSRHSEGSPQEDRQRHQADEQVRDAAQRACMGL